MGNIKLICDVKAEWLDYNGHMNDAEYARVFSHAVEELMITIGIDEAFRQEFKYSIFTLETHICYLAEAHKGETLSVSYHLLDHDEKRLHVFFTMQNSSGEELATSEQMLMGMDMKAGRPGSFPELMKQKIETIVKEQADLSVPQKVGSKIGIRRK